jgi:putative hemolysin
MIEIVVLILLILINGFFALSEIALVSSKKTRLKQEMLKGSKGALTALKLLDNSENFLSAIQVGITLIGIVTGVYGGISIADDITPFFERIESIKEFAGEIALTITVLIITYLSIVIGELVPKTIALSNPDKIAIKVAPIVYYFSKVFYPFVRLLSISTNFVNKILGVKKHNDRITESELRQMIKTASLEGVIENDQNTLHEKVFYFADKKAKHIMTHRTEVEWIDLKMPAEKIYEDLLKCHHSKIICSEENLDELKGILNVKDFFKSVSCNSEYSITDLLREPIIVPESTDAQKVLKMLRTNKTHICCVVNEFGGFEGIITLHDIIENIVGQIQEDGEEYEPDVFIREDKTVLVNGDAPIETLGEIIPNFTIDFETIDYSTVAGFVLNQINKIPATGDKFEYLDWQFEIVDMDRNKIDKILISGKQPQG